MTIFMTGGARFIGANLVRQQISEADSRVVNAGNLNSLCDCHNDPRHRFERVDIADPAAVQKVFSNYL